MLFANYLYLNAIYIVLLVCIFLCKNDDNDQVLLFSQWEKSIVTEPFSKNIAIFLCIYIAWAVRNQHTVVKCTWHLVYRFFLCVCKTSDKQRVPILKKTTCNYGEYIHVNCIYYVQKSPKNVSNLKIFDLCVFIVKTNKTYPSDW